MKTYYYMVCTYCQGGIGVGEGHENVEIAGVGRFYAHIKCRKEYREKVRKQIEASYKKQKSRVGEYDVREFDNQIDDSIGHHSNLPIDFKEEDYTHF